MSESPLWKNQCDAARNLKEAFGPEIALSYLIGEKFFGFLRAVNRRPALRAELGAFRAEIKAIFRSWEIGAYLDRLGRFRAAAAMADDVIKTRDVLALVGRMRVFLLAESEAGLSTRRAP